MHKYSATVGQGSNGHTNTIHDIYAANANAAWTAAKLRLGPGQWVISVVCLA